MASRNSTPSGVGPVSSGAVDISTIVAMSHMPTLDGVRAVAAFSVIVFHARYGDFFDGVTAFFVLSGFLITSLLIKERESTGTVSLKAFYARRTLRIFPAYYACVVASLIIDYFGGQPWSGTLAASAFGYWVNYYNAFHGHPSTSIAHLWSLAIEEQFYLLWPAVFVLLRRRGIARVRWTLILVIGGSVLWRLFLYHQLGRRGAYLYNAFDARLDNLAVGCLLATLVSSPRFVRFSRLISARPWAPLVTIGLMSVLAGALSSLNRQLFGFVTYGVLVAVLIVQLLMLHAHVMWRWLDYRPITYLGTISYPFYLYHSWGLGLGDWLTMFPRFGRFIASVFFTIVGASGSYFFVERPFLILKRRLAVRTHETVPVVLAASDAASRL